MIDSKLSEEIKLLKKQSKTDITVPNENADPPIQKRESQRPSKPDFRKLKSIVKEKIIKPQTQEKEKEKEKEKQKEKEKEGDDDDEEVLDLEFDSYVYLGVVLPDFILIFYKIMSGIWSKMAVKEKSMVHNMMLSVKYVCFSLAKISLFFVLLIPGLLVPFIQIVVIGSFDKGNLDLDLIDYNKKLLSVAKIFMIFMFSCMALKECSNALKNWLHTIFYMKRLEKYTSILSAFKNVEKNTDSGFKISYYISRVACFLPGLSQLSVSLFIENYSTYIIVNCQTTVDLIANFAGLYVILEFDNLMIDFLKTSYLDQAMVNYVKFIVDIMKEFISEGDILLDLEKSIKKMFKSESIEIKERKAKKYGIQWIFKAHKILIWITIALQFIVIGMTFISFDGETKIASDSSL